jgi:uncharacterized protein (DUF488 family)
VTAIFSIGHGDRPIAEMLAILSAREVRTLVDVRARPVSVRHAQFMQEALRRSLEAEGIAYHWAGRQLGGFRPARAASRHKALTDASLRGFADYMEGAEFQRGARQLMSLAGKQGPLAFMCSERDPAHCHRSLIADFLARSGVEVIHLLEPGVERPHVLNSRARIESNMLVYDLAS